MMPPLEAIIATWAPFAALFTQPVWHHVQVLWMGAVLCRGPRTVASVLRVMGLGGERRFEKYHRVLSRARWSGLQGAKILLGLLIALLPRDWPLTVVADETIERRKGRRNKRPRSKLRGIGLPKNAASCVEWTRRDSNRGSQHPTDPVSPGSVPRPRGPATTAARPRLGGWRLSRRHARPARPVGIRLPGGY